MSNQQKLPDMRDLTRGPFLHDGKAPSAEDMKISALMRLADAAEQHNQLLGRFVALAERLDKRQTVTEAKQKATDQAVTGVKGQITRLRRELRETGVFTNYNDETPQH